MDKFPQTIQTDRLVLRQPCEGMEEAMLNFTPPLIDQVEGYPHQLTFPAFENPEHVRQAIKFYTNHQPADHYTYYGFAIRTPNKIAVEVNTSPKSEGLEIYWSTDGRHQGLGYATHAAQALIKTANKAGFRNIFARISPQNHASIKIASRLGMVCNNPKHPNLYFWQQALSNVKPHRNSLNFPI